MIIVALLTIITTLMDNIPITGPTFDPSFWDAVDNAMQYIEDAFAILNTFIGINGMRSIGYFLVLIILINTFYMGYQFFCWIVKKFPFINFQP